MAFDQPPAVVAFDVIETVFSLESLRPGLEAVGLPGHVLETWFAQILRDAFALDATGVYNPFRDVATATLRSLFAVSKQLDPAEINRVTEGFSTLDAHSDAAPAMRALRDARVRVVALTNGSAGVTQQLLERSGLDEFIERVISVDEVKCWKPRREVYLHCAEAVGVEPGHIALIAAHAWDIHGARRAGLMAGFVTRRKEPFPAIMEGPNVTGSTLVEVAEGLLKLS